MDSGIPKIPLQLMSWNWNLLIYSFLATCVFDCIFGLCFLFVVSGFCFPLALSVRLHLQQLLNGNSKNILNQIIPIFLVSNPSLSRSIQLMTNFLETNWIFKNTEAGSNFPLGLNIPRLNTLIQLWSMECFEFIKLIVLFYVICNSSKFLTRNDL